MQTAQAPQPIVIESNDSGSLDHLPKVSSSSLQGDEETELMPDKDRKISTYYESMCYAHASKETKDDKVGLHIRRSAVWDVIYVSRINEDSKFAKSKLEQGMVILTVNGMRCPQTVKEARKVFKECEGGLTIMAAKTVSAINLVEGDGIATTKDEESTDDGREMVKAEDWSDGPEVMTDDEEPCRLAKSQSYEDMEKLNGALATLHRRTSEPIHLKPKQDHRSKRSITQRTRGYSPVRITTIDHTGALKITPKNSPETDRESVAFSPKVSPSPISSDSEKQVAISLKISPLPPRPDTAPSNQAASISPLPPRPRAPSGEDLDRKAKRDARRTIRLANSPVNSKPGAYSVAGAGRRPADGKGARSLSPHVKREQAHPTTRRARATGSLSPGPAAGRASRFNHRASAPMMQGTHFGDEMAIFRESAPAIQSIPNLSSPDSSSDAKLPPVNDVGVGVGVGVVISDDDAALRNSGPTDVSANASFSSSTLEPNMEEDFEQVTREDDINRSSSAEMSVGVLSNPDADDAVVVAAEVSENPEAIEERIRQQILEETARADVVRVEHGAKDTRDESTTEEQLQQQKPRGVKEKLFGDGKSKDIALDIAVSPEEYIRKREHLPWTVKQNTVTDLWVASVETDQKAWETSSAGTKHTFSGRTEKEASQAGFAMATPVLQSFGDNPSCCLCKTKFAVFQQPHNCRNCGIVVCSKCRCVWSSKRLPATYQTSKSTHSVCLACDWSHTNFKEALLNGDHSKAVKLYEAGNINLRSPYHPLKKKRGEEVLYPIHMAILGGNVDLVRWLVSEKFCPLESDAKGKGNKSKTALATSKGRTPLGLAINQKHYDILKYLVAERGLSLYDEDLKSDYNNVLAHLTHTLLMAPYTTTSSSQPKIDVDIEAKVERAGRPSVITPSRPSTTSHTSSTRSRSAISLSSSTRSSTASQSSSTPSRPLNTSQSLSPIRSRLSNTSQSTSPKRESSTMFDI